MASVADEGVDERGFETLAIHAGQEPDPTTGAVITPLYLTSTFAQDGVGGLRGGYEYSRSANPTRTALETCLAALEGGTRGFAFASGLAAEDTVLRALCRPGDHVVIPGDAYGGTFRLFAKVLERWGLDLHRGRPARSRRGPRSDDRQDPDDLVRDPDQPAAGHRRHRARLPGSPTTPVRCWPSTTRSRRRTCSGRIALGADVVMHSTTKYLGGHSDVIGGALDRHVTTSSPSRSPSTTTRWAPSPARSTHGWCCAA